MDEGEGAPASVACQGGTECRLNARGNISTATFERLRVAAVLLSPSRQRRLFTRRSVHKPAIDVFLSVIFRTAAMTFSWW